MADEEDDERQPVFDDDEQEGGVFRWMSAAVVALAVAGFFGLAWYAYKNGGETVDEKDVELIRADKTPVKEAPANPGGMEIPNQDKTVYGLISGKANEPVVERILPAPEEPLQRSNDTETWMSDKAKNKAGGGVETMKMGASGTAPAPAPETMTPPPTREQYNPAKLREETQTADASPPAALPAISSTPPAEVAPAAPSKPAMDETKEAPEKPKETPAPAASEDAGDEEEKPVSKPKPVPKEKAEPKEKPVPKESTKPPPSGTRVQLGSYKSQGEAERNWTRIHQKFSDDLQDKQHYIVRADLGHKGVFYRLQVAPFASGRLAEEFCIDFVSAGQGCILTKGK